MISFIGSLRSVNIKSKVGEDNRTVHNLQFSIQITDGVENVQDVVDSLKELVEVKITNVQPTLDESSTMNLPYKDEE